MKRQITQFDSDRNNATVATPTCSSCCCCCCCLTTTLASSTILARRINKEAREKKIKDPVGLTILAALYLPVIGLLSYVFIYLLNRDLGSCTQQYYTYTYGSTSYKICSTPANGFIVPMVIILTFLVLFYLYSRVRMRRPLLRTAIVTIILAQFFIAEAFVGAALILTGIGGIVYLCFVPVLYGFTQRFYSKYVMHQNILGNKIGS